MDESKLQEKHHGSPLTRRRSTAGLCLDLVAALSGCAGSSDGAVSATPDTGPSPVTPPPDGTGSTSTGSSTGTATPPATAVPSTTTSNTATASATAPTWTVADSGALALNAGATSDLTAMLPAGVARGGVFELDASGAALPDGIALLPTGALAVSGSATGTTSGVVFRYTPPA